MGELVQLILKKWLSYLVTVSDNEFVHMYDVTEYN